jgi:putative ATP-grasp target RiPP
MRRSPTNFLTQRGRKGLYAGNMRHWRFGVRPFTLNYTLPSGCPTVVMPYRFDESRQLNVLPDGRPAVSEPGLLLAAGTTTSTAGSKTHFDD